MKFNEVLNKYMDLINCNSKTLAKEALLSETAISRYKKGLRTPNEESIKKIAKALETLSNQKYKEKSLEKEFKNTLNTTEIDFEVVKNNLNEIINTLNINVGELAKYLNFDASYLSRIRKGERIPSNKEDFINSTATFILKKYNNEEYQTSLTILFGKEKINVEDIKKWIYSNNQKIKNEITEFLKKMDSFNLNDYIKAIKFDELKVPNIPFYKEKTRSYYGLEEMKKGELNFFKSTVLSKSKEDIFMCSDMPMEDMAKDIDFGKKWMFAIAMSLKKGLHLNIIHNLDRPFNEMMLGLESWIPIYMTGQVSPYYFSEIKNTVYNHLNYTSGSTALIGESIKGFHNKGKYYLTTNKKEVDYYKEKTKLLLEKAKPLMEIYKENDKDKYNLFILNDLKIKNNRERILSSLPLFTINDDLLIEILKKNNIKKNDIEKLLNYKKEEEKNTKLLLKTNTITDTIYNINKDNFNNDEVYLTFNNMFFNKKIKYSFDEYSKHLKSTIQFAEKNNNYNLKINDYKTFNNITIYIVKNSYVVISKDNNPTIKFVIKHPKLINAIENFNPLVKE